MSSADTLKAFRENRFPINPPLPQGFDHTPNEERPAWQVEFLWGRPYIEKSNERFDVRCLDGEARDGATLWGMFGNIEEALKCCKTGPAWGGQKLAKRDLDQQEQHGMTKEQMQARIRLLAKEIVVNEEKNRFMQEEINALYNKLDAEPK